MTACGARGAAGARTILAFDFGHRRLGVAVGDEALGTASPLTTLRSVAGAPDWQGLTDLVGTWQPGLLVVGRPCNMDGTNSRLTEHAEAFAATLAERFALDVAMVDERLTSFEAREQLKEQRSSGARRRRVQREDVDRAAAALILQSWLENSPP